MPVFDADAGRAPAAGPGGALVAEIEARFPGTDAPACVDRSALAERVLGEPRELPRLEAIVHPGGARARARRFLAEHADAPLVVFDIPLLFEKGGESGSTRSSWSPRRPRSSASACSPGPA